MQTGSPSALTRRARRCRTVRDIAQEDRVVHVPHSPATPIEQVADWVEIVVPVAVDVSQRRRWVAADERLPRSRTAVVVTHDVWSIRAVTQTGRVRSTAQDGAEVVHDLM